jgi:hypothetical protein
VADWSFGQWGGQVFPGYANLLQNLLAWMTASGGGTAPPGSIGGGRPSPVVSERGTLGTIPFPSSPPLVPVPGSIPPPPSPTVPGRPGGVSLPDRLPGAIGGAVARSIIRGGWIGALFFPDANPGGRGSQLCIETQYGPFCPPGLPGAYAVPAPAAVPGSRGRRRPRAVPASPGRRRRARAPAVPGAAAPPVPRPRGRPVTISQPRVEVSPATAAVIRTPPAQSRPPMPASIPQAQTVSLPRSSSIPAPATIPATVPRSSVLPTLASFVLPALGAWVTSIPGASIGAVPSTPTIPGQLPGLGSFPGAGPAPALNPQLAPLTAFSTAPALSPAQELDRQCRERAKRKRKKRKDRTVCWKGSYVETRKGTLKKRREKIRCQ